MTDRLIPLLEQLHPGRTIYLPGATGESLALADALRAAPERAAGVRFVSCFVPGMNEFDYAGLHPDARVTSFMLPRAMQGSFREGRVDLIPRTYSGIADTLARSTFDVAVAHVALPGNDGRCSLGIASDFVPLVWHRAAQRVMIVNPAMPAISRGPRLNPQDADIVLEAEGELVLASPQAASDEADRIAGLVAGLIPDDAAIQVGIGGAPGAIWPRLRDHRGLKLRSGMANDGLLDLTAAGALAEDGHQVGIAYGNRELYDYLARSDLVSFATTIETHGAGLAGIDRFHAINSALEVDLFGQINVEWQAGHLSSGVGGAADFARAAIASPGGRAIVALPATAKAGTLSRVVPRLTAPATGLPRTDADVVVTEHGVADIRDLGLDRRAEALIEIAHPSFRAALQEEWRALRTTF